MSRADLTIPSRREVIYCAGPFSDTAMHSKAENIVRAVWQGKRVRELGLVPFVPHVAILGGCSWQHGQDECLEHVQRADAVLMLEDWTLSRGALQERALAEALGLPVFDGLASLEAAAGASLGMPVTLHGRLRCFWELLEVQAAREVRAGMPPPDHRPGLWILKEGLWRIRVNPFPTMAGDRSDGLKIPPRSAAIEYAGNHVGILEPLSATLRPDGPQGPSGASLLPGLLQVLAREAEASRESAS